jgi:aminoglycoside phosphotransferase (APT) family kinase protein
MARGAPMPLRSLSARVPSARVVGCAPWTLFTQPAQGRALVLGDALSPDVAALAQLGLRVVVADTDAGRIGHIPRGVRVARSGALPFADGAFALVVAHGRWDAAELKRIGTGERVWIGAASSRGPGRRLALLPSVARCEQVAALDGAFPRVAVQPGQRRERWLRAAQSTGTLGFVHRARARFEGARGATRLELLLADIAQRLDEPVPASEHVLASCGGTLEVWTAAGRGAGGRWRLHLATRSEHVPALEHGHRLQAELRRDAPGTPVPEPLALAQTAGLWAVCERRVDGWPLTARRARDPAPLLRQVSRALAGLARGEPRTLARRDVEQALEGWRAECARPDPAFDRRAERMGESLAGLILRDVALHGDLRPRHVLVDGACRLVALVHWSLGRARGWPMLDLVHLWLHLRRAASGTSLGRLLALAAERSGLEPWERALFDEHAAWMGLDRDAWRMLLCAWPLHAASVAGRFSPEFDATAFARELEGAPQFPSDRGH